MSNSKINQAVVISPLLSFLSVILLQDVEVKVHAGLMKEQEFFESIFSSNGKSDSKVISRSQYIKTAKINLYQFFKQNNYSKQLVMAQSKKYPIIERYYSHFFKLYDEFAKEKGTHIPILFVAYVLQYLKRKGVLKLDQKITDQDTMFGLLVYKSNIPDQERMEYKNLVDTMFETLDKVKINKKRRVSKTRRR